MPEITVPGLRYNWLPHEEKYGRAIEGLEDQLSDAHGEIERLRKQIARAQGWLGQIGTTKKGSGVCVRSAQAELNAALNPETAASSSLQSPMEDS